MPFFAHLGRNDYWEVRDNVHTILDEIPTASAAENIADAMNEAYRRGFADAQDAIKSAIGIGR